MCTWCRLILSCSANQWTGFYMITASVMKELNTFYSRKNCGMTMLRFAWPTVDIYFQKLRIHFYRPRFISISQNSFSPLKIYFHWSRFLFSINRYSTSRYLFSLLKSKAYLEPSQTSKMKRFEKIFIGFLSLATFAKGSILCVWQGYENSLWKLLYFFHQSRFVPTRKDCLVCRL